MAKPVGSLILPGPEGSQSSVTFKVMELESPMLEMDGKKAKPKYQIQVHIIRSDFPQDEISSIVIEDKKQLKLLYDFLGTMVYGH